MLPANPFAHTQTHQGLDVKKQPCTTNRRTFLSSLCMHSPVGSRPTALPSCVDLHAWPACVCKRHAHVTAPGAQQSCCLVVQSLSIAARKRISQVAVHASTLQSSSTRTGKGQAIERKSNGRALANALSCLQGGAGSTLRHLLPHPAATRVVVWPSPQLLWRCAECTDASSASAGRRPTLLAATRLPG